MASSSSYDVVIIGGGILGTMLAYELAKRDERKRIAVLEKEDDAARHTSSRNTGVLHRPFYLDPEKKKKFAACAQESYGFWKAYAAEKYLPWKEVGTIEVALDAEGVQRLQQYKQWSLQNGMCDNEVRLLSAGEVRAIEPNVRCVGALLCTTDTAVDFGAFTRALKEDAQARGVQFLFGCSVEDVQEESENVVVRCNNSTNITARFLINCAGGHALRIAHQMDLARDYANLYFRGDYLLVEGESAQLATHNIYSVPRHSAFPFLDPHYVVRHDGSVVIGPTAVPVFGPYVYEGVGHLAKFFERPLLNKLRLFLNPEFLTLCAQEWRSALSRRTLLSRVRQFLPDLRENNCRQRGNAGVRASPIDAKGNFVPEVVEVSNPRSLHILNYNSPGATGAPAYVRYLTEKFFP